MESTNRKKYQQWYKDALEIIFNKMSIEQKEELYNKFHIPLGTSLNLVGKSLDKKFEFIPKEILIESARIVGLDSKEIESLDFIHLNEYQLTKSEKQDIKPIAINKNPNKLTPQKILDSLNTVVMSQDKAKKKIATAIYYQLKSFKDKTTNQSLNTNSPLLLAGNTGTGKTFVVQKATQFTDLNFIHVDASSMVSTGIVGYSIDDIVKEIVRNANYDKNLAEHSVVFFDECDKILEKEYGKSIVSQLLRFCEGADYVISITNHDTDECQLGKVKNISTKNMLIIFGGSFQTIIDKSVVGFAKEQIEKKLSYDDIENSGFPKELLGRIKQVVILDKLSQQDYLKILTKSNESPLNAYIQKLKEDNNEVIIEDEVLKEIANIAYKSNLGVRKINQVLEELFEDIMFKSPESSYQRFNITMDDLNKII